MKAIPIVIAIILIAIVAVIVIGVTGGFDCGGTPTPTPTISPTPTPTSTATPTTTPTPTSTPTPLTPPIVTDISPDTFHQGETYRLTFSLKNQSPLLYENVYVFCHSVSNDGETWIQPAPDWSNEVTLAPDATAEVTVDAMTGIDRTPGDYTLEYHVRYTYDGVKYSSEHYYPTLSVTAPNNDITATVSPPTTIGQGEQKDFDFLLENKSSYDYGDIWIVWESVENDTGEIWDEPQNVAAFVEDPLLAGQNEEVTMTAVTSSDQTLGQYTLSYYIHFTGEGDREFETRYEELVTVQ